MAPASARYSLSGTRPAAIKASVPRLIALSERAHADMARRERAKRLGPDFSPARPDIPKRLRRLLGHVRSHWTKTPAAGYIQHGPGG